MFRVLPSVRWAAAVLWLLATGVLRVFGTDWFLTGVFVAVGVWFQFYLAGQKIYFEKGAFIKLSGNIFNRRLVLLLKNVCGVHIIYLHPLLPALIKIIYPGSDIMVVGMSGRQAVAIEKIIRTHALY